MKAALDIFHNYSGLKLNMSKTNAIIVHNNDFIPQNDKWGIKWTQKPFKTLGTWFANDLAEMASLNLSAN